MQKLDSVDISQIISIFNRIDFFKHFTAVDKNRIASYNSHLLIFDQGELIIKEGENDHHFFVLLSGKVKVVKEKNCFLSNISLGDFFGEMAYLTNSKRSATVIADDKVIVLKVDQRMLKGLTPEVRERFKDRIIEKLVFRLSETNKKLSEFENLNDEPK